MVSTNCSGNRIRESLLDAVTVTKATGGWNGWNTKEACLYHNNLVILGGLLWIMDYYGLLWIIMGYYGLWWDNKRQPK